MAPPKDIARSYPKRGITADVGFRSEPFFCGEGSFNSTQNAGNAIQFDPDFTFTNGLSVTYWMWHNGESATRYNGFFGQVAFGSITANSLRFHSKQLGASYDVANAFEARVWNHVCFTLSQDGTAVKCYLNGVEQTLGSQPASALTLPSGSGIADGGIATFQNDASAGSLSMGGYMAKYALYNAVLTQDQVRQIMRAQTFAEVNAIQACQFYFELAANNTDSTGNATTVEDRGTVTYGVTKPQLPHGLDLARGAAQARCFTGRGVDFDGSADGLSSTATLSINTSGAKATLACWVNPDVSTSGNKTIISNTIDTNNNQFTIYQNGTSYAVSAVYASGFTKVNHFANTQVTVGAWTFLCAVWNFDATSLTFYVNGVSFTDTPSTAVGSTNNTFEIGCREPAGSKSQFFDGQIASIQLFDTTLTAAQVRELYHNPEQVLPTGVSASNLRRYYPLSDYNDTGGTGGRRFQDMGADGKPAKDEGSASMVFAQPVPCPQLGLQQSASRIYWDDNTAEKLSATIPAFDSDFTIAFWWFNGPSSDSDLWIEVNTPGLYQFYYDGSQIIYHSSTAGTFNTGVSCAVGEWSHVGITSAGVYKNGVLHTTSFTLDWLGTAYRIFGRHSAALACNGICSNMGFWSDDLSTAEMLELYNQGPGHDPRNNTGNYASSSALTNLWFMDDLTTIKDRKGSNDLTVIGDPIMASFPENASGSTIVGDFSMKRKGVSVLNFFSDPSTVDSHALIPAQESIFPKHPDGFTVSVFFRLQKRGVFSTIYYSEDGAVANQNGVYVTSANQIWLEAGDGGTSTTRLRLKTGTLSLDGEWHHYAATITHGTPTTGKAYFDGVLNATDTSVTQTGSPAISNIAIGDYLPGGTNEARGPIACLRFYRGPLSENEIKQIYNSDLRLIKGLNNE